MIASQTLNIFLIFLKNAYVLQVGRGKNLTTALYSVITKPEDFICLNNDYKKSKNNKTSKCAQTLNSFSPEI